MSDMIDDFMEDCHTFLNHTTPIMKACEGDVELCKMARPDVLFHAQKINESVDCLMKIGVPLGFGFLGEPEVMMIYVNHHITKLKKQFCFEWDDIIPTNTFAPIQISGEEGDWD